MLKTQNLQFAYAKGPLLSYPDLSLDKGESCLVLGKSGCGKSTLLYLLAGLLRPSQGSIRLNDTVYTNLHGNRMNRFRAGNISIIWQEMHYIPSLNVKENLLAYAAFLDLRDAGKRITELSQQLGFGEFLEKPAQELSRGQLQRVAVGRALLNRSSLILADEPTASLDDENAGIVSRLLLEHSRKAGLLMVSHDRRLAGHTTKQIEL